MDGTVRNNIQIFITAIVGYFMGYQVAYNKNQGQSDQETFYAEITDIDETGMTVKGMEVNDIKYQ